MKLYLSLKGTLRVKHCSRLGDFTGFCSENEGHFSCEVSLTAITEFNITVTLKRTASLLPNSFSKKGL